MSYYNEIKKIAEDIKSRIEVVPEIVIVLGSGLGGLADEIENSQVIEYKDVEGFPVPTVAHHAGKMIFGTLCGKNVVALMGRIHYYECADMMLATKITRIMGCLGINKIILTNAAGGMGDDIKQGDIMAITDHICSFVPSPLIGKNEDKFGARFPDMTNVYRTDITEKVFEKMALEGVVLKKGVYLQTTGPNYETPAEIKMYKGFGASAVGMSTACEAMVARHMGMDICGYSCITNMAAGISKVELTHEEVGMIAEQASEKFKKIIRETVKNF